MRQPPESRSHHSKTGADLNVPCSLSKGLEAKFVSDFSGIHGIGKILLVGEDKKKGVPKFVLIQHPLKFFTSLRDTFPIIRVNHKDDSLRVLEI